ncbi:MAG: transposase [Candidatus Omnitrophota bacterium]|nr:transposase [Candidatus Omnitrophota bacterium]
MRRKEILATGEVYHVFSKSIALFKIFNSDADFSRMKRMLKYYQLENQPDKFSRFLEIERTQKEGFDKHFESVAGKSKKLVEIIAYCFMPTHLHLILKQLEDRGISFFMSNLLNSYSRYFNIKHGRKGPLWESKFKAVLVDSDEQLLHLTRYVHLNPATARIVDKPQDWRDSSYLEYSSYDGVENRVCNYKGVLDIEPVSYKKFVEDMISYQRHLDDIKKLILEEGSEL